MAPRRSARLEAANTNAKAKPTANISRAAPEPTTKVKRAATKPTAKVEKAASKPKARVKKAAATEKSTTKAKKAATKKATARVLDAVLVEEGPADDDFRQPVGRRRKKTAEERDAKLEQYLEPGSTEGRAGDEQTDMEPEEMAPEEMEAVKTEPAEMEPVEMESSAEEAPDRPPLTLEGFENYALNKVLEDLQATLHNLTGRNSSFVEITGGRVGESLKVRAVRRALRRFVMDLGKDELKRMPLVSAVEENDVSRIPLE